MGRYEPTQCGSRALARALEWMARLDAAGRTYAPFEPTLEMTKAGAAAGKVAPETATRIYKAMLAAL
jgi:hypothetical protein